MICDREFTREARNPDEVLFTDGYTWQNFGLRFLGLVNRLYTVHSSLVAYLAQVKSVKNYPTRSDSVLSWAWVF
jgi:hypothetical protein